MNHKFVNAIFLTLMTVSSIALSQGLADLLGAAPFGDPFKISKTEIKKAEHPCPTVSSASRNSDGTISAKCSNKETYIIFSLNNAPIVMRCSVAKELGIDGCSEDTTNESCYDLGVRYGRCGYLTYTGRTCPEIDDFVMPVKCRGTAETQKGILAGAKEVKQKVMGADSN